MLGDEAVYVAAAGAEALSVGMMKDLGVQVEVDVGAVLGVLRGWSTGDGGRRGGGGGGGAAGPHSSKEGPEGLNNGKGKQYQAQQQGKQKGGEAGQGALCSLSPSRLHAMYAFLSRQAFMSSAEAAEVQAAFQQRPLIWLPLPPPPGPEADSDNDSSSENESDSDSESESSSSESSESSGSSSDSDSESSGGGGKGVDGEKSETPQVLPPPQTGKGLAATEAVGDRVSGRFYACGDVCWSDPAQVMEEVHTLTFSISTSNRQRGGSQGVAHSVHQHLLRPLSPHYPALRHFFKEQLGADSGASGVDGDDGQKAGRGGAGAGDVAVAAAAAAAGGTGMPDGVLPQPQLRHYCSALHALAGNCNSSAPELALRVLSHLAQQLASNTLNVAALRGALKGAPLLPALGGGWCKLQASTFIPDDPWLAEQMGMGAPGGKGPGKGAGPAVMVAGQRLQLLRLPPLPAAALLAGAVGFDPSAPQPAAGTSKGAEKGKKGGSSAKSRMKLPAATPGAGASTASDPAAAAALHALHALYVRLGVQPLSKAVVREVVVGRQGGYRSPVIDGLLAEAMVAAQAYVAHACGGHDTPLFKRCDSECRVAWAAAAVL